MKIHQLIELLSSDERARAVGQIGGRETPSFVLKHLAEWMSIKSDTRGEDWSHAAARLRSIAYEMEGMGL